MTEQLQLVRKRVEEGVLDVGGALLHKTPLRGAGGDECCTQEALTDTGSTWAGSIPVKAALHQQFQRLQFKT